MYVGAYETSSSQNVLQHALSRYVYNRILFVIYRIIYYSRKIKITVNRRFDVSNIILKIEVVYANVKVVKRDLKINFSRIESDCTLSDGFSSFMINIS